MLNWLIKIRLAFLEAKSNYLSDRCYLALRSQRYAEYALYSNSRKRLEERIDTIRKRYSL